MTSLAFVFLLGLAMAALCQQFKIPRIIAILITAPLGAAGMDLTYDKLLVHSKA